MTPPSRSPIFTIFRFLCSSLPFGPSGHEGRWGGFAAVAKKHPKMTLVLAGRWEEPEQVQGSRPFKCGAAWVFRQGRRDQSSGEALPFGGTLASPRRELSRRPRGDRLSAGWRLLRPRYTIGPVIASRCKWRSNPRGVGWRLLRSLRSLAMTSSAGEVGQDGDEQGSNQRNGPSPASVRLRNLAHR